MRLQIAFDYMMVFIFVLLVFTIIFSSIEKQRIELLNEQSFVQLQVVAQTIASEITNAGQSGNGFSATLSLPAGLSIIQYNVSLTKYGSVIVSSNQYGQTVQAVAFSGQRSLLSNSSYLVPPSNTYYRIPTYNGTGQITLQNYQGTICIDYACPSIVNQVSQMTLVSHTAGAAQFSGINPGITVSNMNFNVIGDSYTLCAWLNVPSYHPSSYGDVLVAAQYANSGLVASNPTPSGYQVGSYLGGYSTPLGHAAYGTWNFLCAVYTGAGSTLRTDYINANAVGTDTSGGLVNIINAPLIIGNSGFTCCGDTTNPPDYEANVQMYANALSDNSIKQLYREGITGAPIATANVLGWWPLNGNSNDYSGNRNNGVESGPITYSAVAQLTASAVNSTGKSMAGELIGFSSSIGNFTAGPSASNITSTTGAARAFITQAAYSGHATVTATAFNGNYSTSNNLVGWWPLNMRQGNKVYDISPSSSDMLTYSPGNILYASWADPRYVAQFNGHSTRATPPDYISIPENLKLGGPYGNAMSVSVWVNVSAYLPNPQNKQPLVSSICTPGSSPIFELNLNSDSAQNPDFGVAEEGTNYVSVTAAANVLPDSWYNIIGTYDGNTIKIYVNGVLSGSLASAGSLLQDFNGIMINNEAGCASAFLGRMSNIQLYNTALSAAQVQSLYGEGISGPPQTTSSLVGWWPLNGDVLDYSGNGNNASVFGNVNPVQYGASQHSAAQVLTAQFNGINSYIEQSSGFSFMNSAIQPFTISIWVDPSNPNGVIVDELGQQQSNVAWHDSWIELVNGNVYIRVWPNACVLLGQIPLNQWSSIMMVGTIHGSTLTYSGYLNGVYANSGSGTRSIPGGASPMYYPLGTADGTNCGSGAYYTGQMANYQFYNTSLSSQQVHTLYSEGISGFPVSGAGIAGWWPLDGDTNDYSSNINKGISTNIVYNAVSLNSPGPVPSMSGYGLLFNGANSQVDFGQPPALMTNSFTWSMWINPSAWPGQNNGVFGEGGVSSGEPYMIEQGTPTAPKLQFSNDGGASSTVYDSLIQLNNWQNIVGTYDYATGNISIYQNGKLVQSSITSPIARYASNLYLGYFPASNLYFYGQIADVQIYNAVLTSSQVGQLYNAGMPPMQTVSVPLGVT